MITDWPRPSCRRCATSRAVVSVAPPAGNGTDQLDRLDRIGLRHAYVATAMLAMAIAATARIRTRTIALAAFTALFRLDAGHPDDVGPQWSLLRNDGGKLSRRRDHGIDAELCKSSPSCQASAAGH